MANHIKVYFKSENDVEAVHASLRKLRSISNLYIEEMPEDADIKMFVPFFATNIGSSSATSGSLGTYGSFTPFITKEDSDDDPTYEQMTHLLHFDVGNADYSQVIEILNKNNSYIAQ